jgi:hypothetical protein
MRKPCAGLLACAAIALASSGEALATHTPNHRTVIGSFAFTPAAPIVNQVVTFTSGATAAGQGNRIVFQDWDLDNDGAFDDASGPTATRAFAPAGTYIVRHRAIDRFLNEAIVSQSVMVGDPPPVPVLSPFPVVQMGGRVTRKGTRVLVIVRAPVGATITVECRGRGCPLRRQTRVAKATRGAATRLIRLRRLERRRLGAGARITVVVSRDGAIGKYSRFRVRRGRPPKRTDSCIAPGATTPIACPAT